MNQLENTQPLLNFLLNSELLASAAPGAASFTAYTGELDEMERALSMQTVAPILDELPDVLWVLLRAGNEAALRQRALQLATRALASLGQSWCEQDLYSLVRLVASKWCSPRAERRLCRMIASRVAGDWSVHHE